MTWSTRGQFYMNRVSFLSVSIRPPQDVDLLAILEFQIPWYRPETPTFYPRKYFTKNEDHFMDENKDVCDHLRDGNFQRSWTAGTSTSRGTLVSTVTLAWYLLYNRVNRTYYLRYLIVRFLNRFKVVYLQSVTLFTERCLHQYCMFEKYRLIRRFILATIFRNKTDFIHFHYFLFQSGIILFDGF